MAIHDHYLAEDFIQVTDQLENMHKASMAILESATTGTFKADKHKAQLQHSYQILEALNEKKLKREEIGSYDEYTRRHFF